MTFPTSGLSTLIASIPAMLHLTPTDSVIVFSLAYNNNRLTTQDPVVRYDIPPAEHFADYSADAITKVFADTPVDHLVIVVTTADDADQPSPHDLPLRAKVSSLVTLLQAHGFTSVLAVWTPEVTQGAPWRAYTVDGASGVLPDPATTPAAVASAVQGDVIATSRDQLAARLTQAADPVARARLAPLIESAARRAHAERLNPVRATERLARVTSAALAAGQGTLPVDDDNHADLIATFAVPDFRDMLLVADTLQAHRDLEALALHLWTLAPEPHASELVVVLAVHAYQRGDGVWARTTLEAATTSLPLCQLLTLFLDTGAHPRQLTVIARQAASEARSQLGIPCPPAPRTGPSTEHTSSST